MKKVAITMLLLVTFLFAGCDAGNTLLNTPTKQVEIFLTNYQTLDKNVLNDLDAVISEEELFNGEQRERYREIMKDAYQKLAYQIKDQEENGEKAIVTAEIEVIDYGKVLSETKVYLNNNREQFQDEAGEYDASKYVDYQLDKLEKAKQKVKYTIDFQLTKNGEQWQLDNLSNNDLKKIQGVYEY